MAQIAATKEKAVDIGIDEQNREGVIPILSSLLSDEFVLNTKTRNYHWNVIGPHFNDYHKFFEGQYDELSEVVDDVAERIRSIGGKTIATLDEFKRNTRLKEEPEQYPNAIQMVKNLLHDHESIIKTLREDLVRCDESFHDIGTNDFLTGLMEKHEKMAWMLRSLAST